MPGGAVGFLIQRKARQASDRYRPLHQSMESTMTLDTIMVMIAVTGMFVTLALVLAWADRATGEPPRKM